LHKKKVKKHHKLTVQHQKQTLFVKSQERKSFKPKKKKKQKKYKKQRHKDTKSRFPSGTNSKATKNAQANTHEPLTSCSRRCEIPFFQKNTYLTKKWAGKYNKF